MPKVDSKPGRVKKPADAPEHLKPYVALGVSVSWRDGQTQAQGECPFCGKENKFYVSTTDGRFKCFSCTEGTKNGGGNVYTFFKVLWEASMYRTKPGDYKRFGAEKGLARPEELAEWGLCKSYLNDVWIVPGYKVPEGTIAQIYRYMKDDKGHMRFLPCPGFPSGQGQHLLGYGSFDPKKEEAYFCEGLFDGACFRESLRFTRRVKSGSKTAYQVTGDEELSLFNRANVLAVPGCGTFLPSWATPLEDKKVFFLYDNDHPKTNEKNGNYQEPAAHAGLRKAVQTIAGTGVRTEEIRYLRWGDKDEHLDHNPELPDKYDVRDHIVSNSRKLDDRARKVGDIIRRLTPAPVEWLEAPAEGQKAGKAEIKTIPCSDWEELINQWKKALEWTEGLDLALSVMLAAVASTKAVGDQLWVRVMSPASTGKSTLCEALTTNRNHVVAKSTLRGFYSGYKTDRDSTKDHSLVAELRDKTFVLKDGDTLLQQPNLTQILAEARDIYDSVGRSSYRTNAGRDYEGLRMTWILCGTASLHKIDTSELGERFLSCSIMDQIDEELEDEINWRVANRARRNLTQESNCKTDSNYDPDILRAMQLTGGYVDYLRANAQTLLTEVEKNVTDETMKFICKLGVFTAHMRARPSKSQDDTMERELSSRLVSQMVRLAMCLAVVMGKKTVDGEVVKRVRKVALDTSKGKTITICKWLYKIGAVGVEPRALARVANMADATTRNHLLYLKQIKVVESFAPAAGAVQHRYRLTERMVRLYKLVVEEE